MRVIRNALISVHDKGGLEQLLDVLREFDVTIFSTGGTARKISELGFAHRDVSELTGFVEMLDGRVKTLHPVLHAGILARRDIESHMSALEKVGAVPFDLVVVNLYPFTQHVTSGTHESEALELIDVGGPTMIRAAAKNHPGVAVVSRVDQYREVADELKAREGRLAASTRKRLAGEAFELLSSYDAKISNYLKQDPADAETGSDEISQPLPASLDLRLFRSAELRYGENPHQRAAFYTESGVEGFSGAGFVQLGGKGLSYNNMSDLDAALRLAAEFEEPVSVIMKHQNPCGAGTGNTLPEAFERALATDSVSAFGGIVSFNRPVDAALAAELKKMFLEVIAAPGFDEDALAILRKKKKLRLLRADPAEWRVRGLDFRPVRGGFLVQDRDAASPGEITFDAVTKKRPDERERRALLFAWKVVKHIRSNAVVFTSENGTLGVGAGQMSRVDSVRLAVMKAAQAGLSLEGSVLASDAFFPFPDGVEEAVKAGTTSIIQPGGSIRDKKVIAAADDLGVSMVLTGTRHFRH